MTLRRFRNLAWIPALLLFLVSCGTDDQVPQQDSDQVPQQDSSDRLLVVTTTNILADITSNVVGDDADLVVLIPVGGDPHDYQMSAAQVAMLHDTDLVISNGLGLEETIHDVLMAAQSDGVNLLEIGPMLDPLSYADEGEPEDDGHGEDDDHADGDADGDAHEEDDDDGHDEDDDHAEGDADGDAHEEDEDDGHDEDDDHAEGDADGDAHDDEDDHGHEEDEGGHGHGPMDPHVWMDPLRVAEAAHLIAERLAELDSSIDWEARADAYGAELEDLDAEIQTILAPVPDHLRKLITNHDAMGYFAARYDFEILDTIIPGGSTLAEPSSAEMTALVRTIRSERIPAIFAETIESTALAEALAAEANSEVAVVKLYTGSLGEPGSGAETLIGMLRVNAQLIADALLG